MRKFLYFTMLITASFLIACAPESNTNSANKPANAVNNSATAPAANSAAVETEIKKLVNDTAAALAKNDVAALDKIYGENYMLVNPDGAVQTRAERLASIKSGETKFDSFAYDEINVRSNPEGTGAVVIVRATATGINKGKKIEGPLRVTQVWSKTKDGWRQVSGQATPITGASAAANTSATGPPTANTNTNSGK
ncbi:MAG: nuclear transport factor 2 family protein [Acidobacteriota bacterium]